MNYTNQLPTYPIAASLLCRSAHQRTQAEAFVEPISQDKEEYSTIDAIIASTMYGYNTHHKRTHIQEAPQYLWNFEQGKFTPYELI